MYVLNFREDCDMGGQGGGLMVSIFRRKKAPKDSSNSRCFQSMYYCMLKGVRQTFSWLRKSDTRYHCILCFVNNLNVGFCLSEVKVAVFCIANGFFILLGIER